MLRALGFQFRWCHTSTGTECILVNADTDGVSTPEVVGKASLSSQDKFVKEVGRKISLRRALHNLRLSKEQRTEVWNAYRKMTIPARWEN